jgi:hypothetical protein
VNRCGRNRRTKEGGWIDEAKRDSKKYDGRYGKLPAYEGFSWNGFGKTYVWTYKCSLGGFLGDTVADGRYERFPETKRQAEGWCNDYGHRDLKHGVPD